MKCPFCDGLNVRVDLDANIAISGGKFIRLTRQQAVVLHILADGAPRWVTINELVEKTYGADPVDSADPVIRTTVMLLRKLLRPVGLAILVQYKTGYCLVNLLKGT